MHCEDLTIQVKFGSAMAVPGASVVDYSLGLKGVPNFLKEGCALCPVPSMLGYYPCSADSADMCLVIHFAHLFFPFHGSGSSVKKDA